MPHATLSQKETEQDSHKSFILEKTKNKEEFCKSYDLTYNKKIPLLCVTYPLTDQNKVSILQEAMEGILEQPVQIALLGIGTQKYQNYFTLLAEKYPEKVVIVSGNDDEKEALYKSADMLLCSNDSKECASEIVLAMSYGIIPLTPKQEGLEDYNPTEESGNAFVYDQKTSWSLFANLIRALENFKFPYDWKNIVRTVVEQG